MKFSAITIMAVASVVSAAPISVTHKRQALDLGSCGSPAIRFAVGLDGRREAAFQPTNLDDFGHGSAQNIGIITSFICQRLQSSCKAPADTLAACERGRSAAAASQGQAAADAFNIALGAAGGNGGGNEGGNGGNNGDGNEDVVDVPDVIDEPVEVIDDVVDDVEIPPECIDQVDDVDDFDDIDDIVEEDDLVDVNDPNIDDGNDNGGGNGGNGGNGGGNGAFDFGICSDPTMIRVAGLPGRRADEFTFIPNNSDGFFGGQPEALNPAIIANFICDRFDNTCDASDEAKAACRAAQAVVVAANAAGNRGQDVADAFNAALGF